ALDNMLPFIPPTSLPALTALAIRAGQTPGADCVNVPDRIEHAATSLAAKWFKQLATFSWLYASEPVTEADIAALAKVLGKKKLAKLDLTGTKVPLALRDKL